MSYKRIFMLLFIITVILLSITGCTYLQEAGIIQPQPERIQEQPEAQPQPEKPPEQPEPQPKPESTPEQSEAQPQEQPVGAPRPPIEAKLALSHAPIVGETAELTFTIVYHTGTNWGPSRARLEVTWADRLNVPRVEIPSEEVLANGHLNWEGTLSPDSPLEFRTDIRFLREGIWEITGYFELDSNWIRSNRVRLAVQTDRAGIFGSEAHRAGNLDWMDDYSPTVAVRLDSPITAALNLSEPPKLNESAELIWSIASTKNVAEAKVWIEFKLMEPGATKPQKIPGESVLVEGNLQWEGTLERGVIYSSSANVVFPEEGDWEIVLICDDSERISGRATVFINVTEERGCWGWAESHEVDSGQVPPPTPVK